VLKKIRISLSTLLLLTFGSLLYSQDYSQHFISAKSGMVNHVEGEPSIFNPETNQRKKISVGDQLQTNDQISTKENDRVEVLLNPGSYLRLAGKAQLEILQTGLDNMHFGIKEGTAIVEAGVYDKKVHSLKISTPSGDLKVQDKGLYRIEVSPEQQVDVMVYKGQAKWFKNNLEIATLKSGKKFDLTASATGEVQYAKLDKKNTDPFDDWSKKRAEYLVAANERLSPGWLDSAYMNYGYNYRRGGWIYNPFYRCYTFLPFDYAFSSPYGYAYDNFYPAYYYRGGDYRSYPTGRSGGGTSATGNASKSGTTTATRERSTISRSPSAPNSRMDTGRSDAGNRAGARGRISQR
jgi:FecR protein